MYERRGKFYFDSPVTGKWEPLGDDIGKALEAYAKMFRSTWRGRLIGDTIDRYKVDVTAGVTNARRRDAELTTLDRLKAVFGDMEQDNLTQLHLYQYADRRRDTRPLFKDKDRPALTAAKHDIALLRLVLKKGIRWGAGTVNAAFGIEFDLPKKKPAHVPLDVYQAVYSIANERMQIAMDLASNAGPRRGDLLTLRWDEITDEGIPDFEQNKTGERLFMEMTPGLRATLDRARALTPDIPKVYVLRNEQGQPYTGDGFSANWQRLMKKAIDKKLITAEQRFQWKHLRNKAGQDKADAEGLQAASDLLGHTTTATAKKHYVAKLPAKRVRPVR
jgi:integrase